MNPSRLVSLLSPRSIDPRREQIGSSGRPEWTPAEVALGLAGLDEPYASAFRYRWARELELLPFLEQHLAEHARKLAKRECWPARIVNADGERVAFPLNELVQLALLEEHHRWRMRAPEFTAAALNVTERLWRRRLSPKYEALREKIEVWNDIAYRHLRERLREPETA